jgi:high-affinity iron transporter
MFQISVVVFRESLEIFLIFGIVLAATNNLASRHKFIVSGVIMGILGSLLLAHFASSISESFDGSGQELFNIALLSLTIVMIFLTVVWMRDRSTKIKSDFKNLEEQNISNFRAQASLTFMVAALFFREGSEIALFLTSILAVNNFSLYEALLSLSLGLSFGIASGCLIYFGIFQMAGKHIFKITSSLLILIAAGLSAEVANLISSADLTQFGSQIFWDSAWLIDDDEFAGRVLKIIIGYNSKPTALQLVFYFATLSILVAVSNNKPKDHHMK